MAAVIDYTRCNGCNRALEPFCMRICPGDLFQKVTDGTVDIRYPDECWDCAACIKVCPRQALCLVIPVEAGGQGIRLLAKKEKQNIRWKIINKNSQIKEI